MLDCKAVKMLEQTCRDNDLLSYTIELTTMKLSRWNSEDFLMIYYLWRDGFYSADAA